MELSLKAIKWLKRGMHTPLASSAPIGDISKAKTLGGFHRVQKALSKASNYYHGEARISGGRKSPEWFAPAKNYGGFWAREDKPLALEWTHKHNMPLGTLTKANLGPLSRILDEKFVTAADRNRLVDAANMLGKKRGKDYGRTIKLLQSSEARNEFARRQPPLAQTVLDKTILGGPKGLLRTAGYDGVVNRRDLYGTPDVISIPFGMGRGRVKVISDELRQRLQNPISGRYKSIVLAKRVGKRFPRM